MILVTGATGTVGRPLVAGLRAAGHRVRAVVQDIDAAPSSWADPEDVVVADLSDPASLANAMPDVDAIYLLVPAHPLMAQYERNVIEAAALSTNRPRVVLHAAAGVAGTTDGVRFLAAHAQGLADLRASGLSWTVLAPNGFLQNVIGMAALIQDGVLVLPAGDGAVSYVDAVDVAAAAAVVLTTDGHDNAIYTLTGPEAVTHAQIAQRLGDLLDRPVRYQAADASQARAGITEGGGAWLQEGMIELLGLYGTGAAAAVTDDLPRLIGKAARSLDDFLAVNAASVRESVCTR